ANILDPFGFRPQNIIAKYMTVDEKNLNAVNLHGALLTNRIACMSISFVLLFASYFIFSFNSKNEKIKKQKKQKAEDKKIILSNKPYQPTDAGKFKLSVFFYLIWQETKAIIQNPAFIIIVIIGLINLVASLTSFTGRYG